VAVDVEKFASLCLPERREQLADEKVGCGVNCHVDVSMSIPHNGHGLAALVRTQRIVRNIRVAPARLHRRAVTICHRESVLVYRCKWKLPVPVQH